MKKYLITIATICLGLCLTACGNNTNQNKEHASLEAENSSLKASSKRQQIRMSNDEYALAAYLKLQGQTANELKNNEDNMHWDQYGNTYCINFGAHTTSMAVIGSSVGVTYDKPQGDSMGQGNGHKNYSKHQLAREFGNQKGTIDEILESVSQRRAHNDGSANNGQQTKISNNTSSPAKQSSQTSQTANSNATNETSKSSGGHPRLADGTDVYSLPLSDPRNPDGYKQAELMDIAGDPKYHNPDGSMNAEGEALSSSIEATFHQPE